MSSRVASHRSPRRLACIGQPFFERQQADFCALHALNNAIGEARFSRQHFIDADLHHKTGWWGDGTIELVVEGDPSLIARATAASLTHEQWVKIHARPSFLGAVVRVKGNHWVAIRRETDGVASNYEYIDSQRFRTLPDGSTVPIKEMYDPAGIFALLSTRKDGGGVLYLFRHVFGIGEQYEASVSATMRSIFRVEQHSPLTTAHNLPTSPRTTSHDFVCSQ